ncbi:Ig-like domain-containing protein [Pendulispora albinea]|uniref:Ig-like domain-containing protein n=1 Tax=Pendulispora albinea TaxID=2741071 RepID=A0ABZ2M5Z3_9BACT
MRIPNHRCERGKSMRIRRSVRGVGGVTWFMMTAVGMAGSATACGSSESSPASPNKDGGPNDITIHAPVTIVSRTPADGDDNVSVHAPIQVTYSEPVKLGPNAVSLVGPGSVTFGATASLSDDRKTLTVKPVAPLVAPGALAVTMNDVTSVNGGPVEKKAWGWTVPLWLRVGEKTNGAAAYLAAPVVAAGPGERISVVSRLSNDSIVETIDGFQGKWSQIGSPLLTPASFKPSMVLDQAGAVVIAYADSNLDVRVRRWSGVAWDDVGVALGKSRGDVGFRSPAIAVDPTTGNLFVVYSPLDAAEARSIVYVKTFQNGNWLQVGGEVNDPSESGEDLGIAISGGGVKYVQYRSGSSGALNPLRVRQFVSATNRWDLVGATPNPPGEDLSTQSRSLVVDDSGNPAVLACFNNALRLRRWDGASWVSGGDLLGANCTQYAINLKGQSGRLFAFWSDQDKTLKVADVTNKSWTALDPTTASKKVRANSLAIDPGGRPIIAWSEDDDFIKVSRLNR